MQRIELANAFWRLQLLPHWGGRIARLQAAGLDLLTPIDSERFDPLDWPRAGAYPLIPYSNRLRDAQLYFEGVAHRLPAHPAALPHTLHGVSHTLAWQVLEHSPTHLSLACDYAGEHWPWPLRAEQNFSLHGDTLTLGLRVTNCGQQPMPAGLGLHPYFQRHPGMRVAFDAAREWAIDADYLATGASTAPITPSEIDADSPQALARYLSQWDGQLLIDYPQGRLQLRADAVLDHLVVFAPARSPYLCLEPVSHLADAFNRPASQWPQVGTRRLAPGASLHTELNFTWRPAH